MNGQKSLLAGKGGNPPCLLRARRMLKVKGTNKQENVHGLNPAKPSSSDDAV